jgi:hypothetical protein
VKVMLARTFSKFRLTLLASLLAIYVTAPDVLHHPQLGTYKVKVMRPHAKALEQPSSNFSYSPCLLTAVFFLQLGT